MMETVRAVEQAWVMQQAAFAAMLEALAGHYRIYAPVRLHGRGRFSDQDALRYGEVHALREIVFDEKTSFSPKEALLPITETLFYFSEDSFREPATEERGVLIFLRACDIHGLARLDDIFLRNGTQPDTYYARKREKVKYVLLECRQPFTNCFCVSMGCNVTDDFAMAVRAEGDAMYVLVRDATLAGALPPDATPATFTPEFMQEDAVPVVIPQATALTRALHDGLFYTHPLWEEYGRRCIACGRCTVSCVSCSCFTSYDLYYDDNPHAGERRRIWASCHVDHFTEMAGGHSFRQENGTRMRFKALHKIYDFALRFGRQMCVGCGRCDDVCPEYISFAACINRISEALE